MDFDGIMQLQGSSHLVMAGSSSTLLWNIHIVSSTGKFPFGDGGELFDTTMKYSYSKLENTYEIFKANILMITQDITETHQNIVSRKFGAIR